MPTTARQVKLRRVIGVDHFVDHNGARELPLLRDHIEKAYGDSVKKAGLEGLDIGGMSTPVFITSQGVFEEIGWNADYFGQVGQYLKDRGIAVFPLESDDKKAIRSIALIGALGAVQNSYQKFDYSRSGLSYVGSIKPRTLRRMMDYEDVGAEWFDRLSLQVAAAEQAARLLNRVKSPGDMSSAMEDFRIMITVSCIEREVDMAQKILQESTDINVVGAMHSPYLAARLPGYDHIDVVGEDPMYLVEELRPRRDMIEAALRGIPLRQEQS